MLNEENLHNMVAGLKQAEFARKPIRTLGEVVLLLQAQPRENTVRLDFTKDTPIGLDSYRGYYSDLSLNYSEMGSSMSVSQLLKLFEQAEGRTFTGYKGGDFTMHRKTLVWVAEYGSCGRMLIDIKSEDGTTTIYTQEDE